MAFEKIDGNTIAEVKQVEARQTFNVDELKRVRDAYASKRALIVANYPVELARIDGEIAKLDALLAEAAKLGVKPAPEVKPIVDPVAEKLPK